MTLARTENRILRILRWSGFFPRLHIVVQAVLEASPRQKHGKYCSNTANPLSGSSSRAKRMIIPPGDISGNGCNTGGSQSHRTRISSPRCHHTCSNSGGSIASLMDVSTTVFCVPRGTESTRWPRLGANGNQPLTIPHLCSASL